MSDNHRKYHEETDALVAQGLTFHCANDVVYLRRQPGWSQDGEDRLIEAHKSGEVPDVRQFLR